MERSFLDIATTDGVMAAQAENGSRAMMASRDGTRVWTHLTERETAFITARDSFYMATVSETGWPYVQHRGGPSGFIKVLDDKTLAFADFRGNRQYITLGNSRSNDRVALIMVDYPNRRRLKIYARLEVRDLFTDAALAELLSLPGYPARPERALVLHIEAFDWNCPQHITPRFTETEVVAAVAPLRARLEQLEAENAALRGQLAAVTTPNPG
ncbi:MAG: pyridoxamine 5'-phosphate oxidase family protein [Proteobacteria bacterium]|nr:pyridoxamine 5'-phosphate oxidase family protein [Pseudomonadota bacterium]